MAVAPRVVVVGSFNQDHVWTATRLPLPGETLAGRHASGPGGKGFNQAVAAARAGANTAFICALGADDAGELARSLAARDGIALHAQTVDAPTGSAGIFVDAGGANSIVVGPGANAGLSARFVGAQGAAIATARVLLAQLESPADAVAAALRLARAAGATSMLNPAPADAATTPDLLALSDILTPNETEFAALLARHVDQAIDPAVVATLDDETLHRLCRRLLPHGRVVLTMGAAGCFASFPDAAAQRDGSIGPRGCLRLAAEPAQARDSTGAGDAFNGALAAALATDATAPFAGQLRFANRYAALSTERHGAALAMPTRADVAARFGA